MRMKTYLNAGNSGRPMGKPTLDWIKSLGLAGVRTGIYNGIPTPDLKPLIKEIADAEMKAVYIVGGWDFWESNKGRDDEMPSQEAILNDAMRVMEFSLEYGVSSFAIGIGNEPDLTASYKKKNIGRYISTVEYVYAHLASAMPEVQVYACSVSNIDKDNRKYVEKFFQNVDHRIRFDFHPYRTTAEPWDGFSGFKSPHDAAEWVKSIGRPFAISECGWHTAGQKESSGPFGLCKKTVTFDDNDVRDFADYELNLWDHHGAQFYVWYQINDGPDPNYYEHHFGIRYIDGNPKPVASVFANDKV